MSHVDFGCYVDAREGRPTLYVQVDGMRCAACAWKIEQALQAQPGVEAHVNFSTQRLRISWPSELGVAAANGFAHSIEALGFQAAPFDPEGQARNGKAEAVELLSCLAVAGFATLAIMLFTDPLWFLPKEALSGPTRDLMHWVMGLIAMPATLYCGRPFFRSAIAALAHRRANMDVPISLAVVLTNALSLVETIRHGQYVYFDASIMLLFFLLIGRYLDLKSRGKARQTAEGLLAMLDGTAVVERDGVPLSLRIRDIRPGDCLKVASGEKIAADGEIVRGASEVDTRLVTGETLPRPAGVGDRVYAGMINQSAPLDIRVSAAADHSLLSDIVGLMERAEQSQSPFVRLADRVAGWYAPGVHGLALMTFAGWMMAGHVWHVPVTWEDALLKAVSVLIITCPCALGLAVPVVYVLASSRLFAEGILLKSGDALEALSRVDTVVFDKTGTLTAGEPRWLNPQALGAADLALAVAMASASRHPLSQGLCRAAGPVAPVDLEIREHPGQGLTAVGANGRYWLGKATWLDIDAPGDAQTELWFRAETEGVTQAPVRLCFADVERDDAGAVVAELRGLGLEVILLSGDRAGVAQAVGDRLGVDAVIADIGPVGKVAEIERLRAAGRRVLMVGDGLNDAAALTAATVSMSPSTAVDITQNAADLVYRGDLLRPVVTALVTARAAQALVMQNFAISMAYNILAIPAAVLGLVTPLIAAAAMSSSSLIVVLNALRLRMHKKRAG